MQITGFRRRISALRRSTLFVVRCRWRSDMGRYNTASAPVTVIERGSLALGGYETEASSSRRHALFLGETMLISVSYASYAA